MYMKGTAARMGVMKRVSLVFKAKANKALDKMEDPRETLDYSYQRQLELLTKVRRGVADVATSRKRVELQINQLQQSSNKLEDHAGLAGRRGEHRPAADSLHLRQIRSQHRAAGGGRIPARALAQGQLEFGELLADVISCLHEVTRFGAARGAQPRPRDLNRGDGRRADILG